MSLITNLYSDSKALQPLSTWQCSRTQNRDGKYTYFGDNYPWSVFLPGITPGCVIAVDFDSDRRDAFYLESCTAIYSGRTTLAGIYNGGNCTLFCRNGKGVSVTINRIGLYSQDDWNRLRQYGLDWFDGDTMPLG